MSMTVNASAAASYVQAGPGPQPPVATPQTTAAASSDIITLSVAAQSSMASASMLNTAGQAASGVSAAVASIATGLTV